jgi:hypothetical protein
MCLSFSMVSFFKLVISYSLIIVGTLHSFVIFEQDHDRISLILLFSCSNMKSLTTDSLFSPLNVTYSHIIQLKKMF